ncbi:DNA-binding response regulator [candidate division WOR-3 bacterium]|uniref:DNA-binding response regulator n=1 Tax=candidate division WOR-3 bacterium TaxID=2052148 RepID=A0A660SJ24_UNCW3|nr:MAG: DNA-binding response regulator [candidate division WOR-3 bacterium]
MRSLIAIVDDEPDILELVSHNLKKEGFEVKGFEDGESFLFFVRKNPPDLIILDLMLPGIDGLEVCRRLKADENTSSVPIIMLTAKGEEVDRVVGLEMGADDYLVKPFSIRELIARVKAVLRRYKRKEEKPPLVRIRELTIDPARFEVRVGNKKVALTTTEFRILEILARGRGRIFTRRQILHQLWGYDKMVLERTVDVHIARLRKKLGAEGRYIRSVPGMGYKLE